MLRLVTERLILRPRMLSDLDACIAMDREPGTTRWIDGPWDNAQEHADFVRTRIAARYPDGMGYWVLSPRFAPHRFLGWVMLIPEDATGPRVEIGWRLTGAARGHGYAREAASALLEHGIGVLRLTEIVAEIHRDNCASRRLAEAIGMRYAGHGASGDPDTLLYLANASYLSQSRPGVL